MHIPEPENDELLKQLESLQIENQEVITDIGDRNNEVMVLNTKI